MSLIISQTQASRVYGICTSAKHPKDSCPILQDDDDIDTHQDYAKDIFNDKYQLIPYLSSNSYNPDWRYHPNLSWENGNAYTQKSKPSHHNNVVKS